MTPTEGADYAGKAISLLKDLPLWLLAALAVGVNILLFVPAIAMELSEPFRPWLIILCVLSNTLTVFKIFAVTKDKIKESWVSKAKQRAFHISPNPTQCHWSTHRQHDDSMTTQMVVNGLVKNLTEAPLGLVTVRLIKPRIKGEVLDATVMVSQSGRNMYGTTMHSGYRIPPKSISSVGIHFIVRGVSSHNSNQALQAVFGVTDDEGNEHRFKAVLRGEPPPRPTGPAIPLERLFLIANPIEKEIVSVLQSEIARYDKHGRERGALGSVYLVYQDTHMSGFGGDSWNPDSHKNQSIVSNPEAAKILSDNLDAILNLHQSMSSESDKELFIVALLDRLDADKGYLRISYFIVYALMSIGRLEDALIKTRSLPENDTKSYGLSNVLFMLNGMLRYKHSDFTSGMLDQIESLLHNLKTEHTFQISEKIASIRSVRLLNKANSEQPSSTQ